MLDLELEVFIKVKAWKSIDELEENLCLPELDAILGAIRNDEKETKVFQAGLQGVDLTKHFDNPIEERKRAVERRAAERIAGGAEEYERQELAELGIDFG